MELHFQSQWGHNTRHHKNTHRHCKAKLEFKLYVLLYILRVLKDTFGREVNSTKECASLSPFYIRRTQIILCHLHSLPIVYSQTLSRTLSPHTHTHIHMHLLTHTHTHTHTHKHSSDTPLHSILHTYANTFTYLCTHLNVYQLAWFVAILAWDYQNMLYPVYSLDLNIWSGKKCHAQIRTKTGFKADQPDFSLNSVINHSRKLKLVTGVLKMFLKRWLALCSTCQIWNHSLWIKKKKNQSLKDCCPCESPASTKETKFC